MTVKTLPVGQMKANCYLVWDKEGECVIIDPGDDSDFIINTIQQNSLVPRLIVATHGHFDHVMSVLELKLAFNVPFYMHKKDMFLLKRMEDNALYFLGINPGPSPEVDFFLKGNADIRVGDISFKVIHTPGHTPGSVSLYFNGSNSVFVGDLIFEGASLGRTDFKYSEKSDLVKSVQHILELPEETLVYPGHDASTSVSELRHYI